MYFVSNDDILRPELFMGGLPARPDTLGSKNRQIWTTFLIKIKIWTDYTPAKINGQVATLKKYARVNPPARLV